MTLALALSISLLAPLNASKVYAEENAPEIVSEAGIVMDYETGEIIYSKNADTEHYLASTTKLMTALLFAEHMSKTDKLTYTESAKAQPPYTINSEKMQPYGKELKVGDTIDADTAMKGLLVYSGNDFAYMIADAVGGDGDNFVKMMNEKAKELGLTKTTFGNPNGLPENGNDVNISTAYELSIITKAAFENDWIRETMQLKDPKVTLPENTIVTLETRNSELGKNGNIGGKTGVTDQAGTTFSGVYERDGRKLIGTVLKCDRNNNEQRFVDLKDMMDYSYAADKKVFKSAGDEVGTVDLEYKLFKFFGPTKTISANVTLAKDVELYDNDLNNTATITIADDVTDAWKAASSKKVALTVNVLTYNQEATGNIDLSAFDLIKANAFVYIALVMAIAIVILLIVLIVKLMSNRSKRSSFGKNNRRRRRR